QDPVFHSLPASSSSVKVLDENNQGEATPNARIVQPSFSDGGKSLNGYGKDPSGELTLPDPLEAGKAGNPPNKPTVSLFVPVSPEKATIGEVPVAVSRVNAYQNTSHVDISSQRLLPTAKTAAKAASNAGRPDKSEPPLCKRKGRKGNRKHRNH
ncbi:MAG: hypothetical protein QGH62_07685, partial [Nitrospinaceae bacterium]|nr:hypothetical protein [Nitrospinaceae bacterium]